MSARPRNPTPARFWHKGAGQWCLKLDGLFHYLGKDERVAEERRLRLIAERLLHGAPLPKRPVNAALSVAEVLNAYDLHIAGRQAPRELARVRRAIETVMALYGSTPAADFDQLALQAIRLHLLREEDRRLKNETRNLSRRYVNHLVKCVQQAWQWLESQKLVPNGAAAALRTVTALRSGDGGREMPLVLAVAPEVVEATLPHCNPVVAAMVRVQQWTGARPGELVTMRPADVSRSPAEKLRVQLPDKNEIVVAGLDVASVPVWVYAPATHKTRYRGKYRLIAIGPRAQAVLMPFLERESTAFCFSPREAVGEHGGARAPGLRYTVQSYGRSIKAAIAAANALPARNQELGPALPKIPAWRPNQLRHAAGTLADAEGNRDTTAAVLGHASPDTTAIYAEQALGKAAELMARIG